ncbi:hypothetical protein FZC65_10200 [Bacillus pumilus]|nr:hypothetical protein FZC65_10200 [Bacillus pumilus]TYS48155.1 hypothetical protein FZC67_09770 [Bacillus pumilus]
MRIRKSCPVNGQLQRVDKPSHSVSVLCAGAHQCQIRSAKVAVLPRLQRFSITLKRRQRAKIKIILAFVNNLRLSSKWTAFFVLEIIEQVLEGMQLVSFCIC